MTLDTSEASALLDYYRRHLFGHVMPFWTDHCVDEVYGGVTNIVDDAGNVLSTDKFLWSQGRVLWTFSALYNHFGCDRRWLDLAGKTAEFILRYGRSSSGAWNFRLHRDGSVAEPPKSIYVDAFVMYGLTEYARASGDPKCIEAAAAIYDRTAPLLWDHGTLATAPHPIPPGAQSHGPLMIFAHTYHEFGILTAREDVLCTALQLAEKIIQDHVHPELELLLEFVQPDGARMNGNIGSTFVPGHAIESAWFLERIFHHHGKAAYIDLLHDILRWNLEKGWDEEFDGLYLARHAAGGTAVWHNPDAKVWWPHAEALYALLRFFEIGGRTWCLDWYRKLHDYTFSTFPNAENGEWHQNLDRTGRPIGVVVRELSVKDPFHLPRALILSILVLRRFARAQCRRPDPERG